MAREPQVANLSAWLWRGNHQTPHDMILSQYIANDIILFSFIHKILIHCLFSSTNIDKVATGLQVRSSLAFFIGFDPFLLVAREMPFHVNRTRIHVGDHLGRFPFSCAHWQMNKRKIEHFSQWSPDHQQQNESNMSSCLFYCIFIRNRMYIYCVYIQHVARRCINRGCNSLTCQFYCVGLINWDSLRSLEQSYCSWLKL